MGNIFSRILVTGLLCFDQVSAKEIEVRLFRKKERDSVYKKFASVYIDIDDDEQVSELAKQVKNYRLGPSPKTPKIVGENQEVFLSVSSYPLTEKVSSRPLTAKIIRQLPDKVDATIKDNPSCCHQ